MKNELTTQQATPATLIERAIEKGADISHLKELMDLQERWEKKEARKSFFDALSHFQTKAPALKKGKTATVTMKAGGQFKYKYADLGSITKEINPILNECGLSYRWEFAETNGKIKCTCLVSHRDGHTETSSMEAGLDTSGYKNDIQQKGSTQTYLQRYTLIGALGLSTADDDSDAKGLPISAKPAEPQPTEEEFVDQWKDSLAQVKSRIELTTLYMKNRKVVDSNDKIKAMFKERQNEIPKSDSKATKAEMP